jgi:predicted DNA-binding transcriptional regulator
MRKPGQPPDKSIEKAAQDMLTSPARSRVYVYLLRNNGSTTRDIINGTRLHPSTVRELLSKMFNERQIYRKKIKRGNIGKNPFLYYPVSPIDLLKKHAREIEDRLNKIASLALSRGKINDTRTVKIEIEEQAGKT